MTTTRQISPESPPLLVARDVVKSYRRRGRPPVTAVDGVSLQIRRGETFGLVGETGSGKSTLGRLLLGLIRPDRGQITYEGSDITGLSRRQDRDFRRHAQMVFQDPYDSLDPRMRVGEIVGEPLTAQGVDRAERMRRVAEMLERVGMDTSYARRYPHQLSGGQRQRVGIARAVIVRPTLLVQDEPVSALDVSVQSQILNLLNELQRDMGLTYVFISHDLAVVRHVCDRVAVMYLGSFVETGPTEALYERPQHPYTKALLAAIPVSHPRGRRHRPTVRLRGDASTPSTERGCRFCPRCELAEQLAATGRTDSTVTATADGQSSRRAAPEICLSSRPALVESNGTGVACHFAARREDTKEER